MAAGSTGGAMAELESMPTKQDLDAAIRHRYATRVHMSLIVFGSVAVALMATRSLLAVGVHMLLIRYTLALVAAYAAFFAGVWLWLRLSAYGRYLSAGGASGGKSSFLDGVNIDLRGGGGGSSGGGSLGSIARGGGSFDGGGASGSWLRGGAMSTGVFPAAAIANSDGAGGSAIGEGAGKALGGVADALGGDDGWILIVAIALVALALCAVFGAAAFLIYQAPTILGDVVFNVMLASSMVKHAKSVQAEGWQWALLRRTRIPFALVVAATLAFAIFAQVYVPQARTGHEVFQILLSR
jgi:hypothetical protein